MTNEEDRERHRKHLKYKIKEKRQRSEIAKRLLTEGQFKPKRTPRLPEAEEKAFRKYKKFDTDDELS